MKRLLLLTLPLVLSACTADYAMQPKPANLDGKQLAFSRNKGNCLACHMIADGESPGNIGPPLQALASRFDNKQQLRQQIWDARQFNPETSMPPFGTNHILSPAEIDAVVDYLWGL